MVPVVLDRLSGLDAGARLLAALDGLRGVHLVGGAVRDLLLERTPAELDLLAEADGPAIARTLAERVGGELRVHETFGTATVAAGDLRCDVATARAEDYPRPGALPVVRPGTLEEDMARRDFTINAIAVGLSDDVRGTVTSFPGAMADLDARRLRVLHERSFVDDPTRLIRMVRYGTRLGLVLDPRTEQLARAALASAAPVTAGLPRMARELWLLLGEEAAIAGLLLLDELGAGDAWNTDSDVLRRLLDLLPADASREHALLAALGRDVPPEELDAWLREAHIPRPEIVLDAAADPDALARAMATTRRRSDLAAAVRGRSPEAITVAGAVAAPMHARHWLGDLRHRTLAISGADLLAAGVPQGPELGARLDRARAAMLDGDADSRDEQLAVALGS